MGQDSAVGIATRYGLNDTGIESRWGDEIFRTCPDRPWGPPSLLYNGYRVFLGVKSGRGATLTPHHLLVPRSWKSRAILLLPLWAVRPVQSLSACTRVHFTFTFNATKCFSPCLLMRTRVDCPCYVNVTHVFMLRRGIILQLRKLDITTYNCCYAYWFIVVTLTV